MKFFTFVGNDKKLAHTSREDLGEGKMFDYEYFAPFPLYDKEFKMLNTFPAEFHLDSDF